MYYTFRSALRGSLPRGKYEVVMGKKEVLFLLMALVLLLLLATTGGFAYLLDFVRGIA